MGEIVTLTPGEMLMGANVGVMRNLNAIVKGYEDKHGFEEEEQWEVNIVAAQAEVAVAKYLNLYWSGATSFAADVGGLVEVRSVAAEYKRLLVYKTSADEKPFVSVWRIDKKKMDFDLRGWMYGKDAKVDKYWCDPKGSGRFNFFVETRDLHPMNRLKASLPK